MRSSCFAILYAGGMGLAALTLGAADAAARHRRIGRAVGSQPVRQGAAAERRCVTAGECLAQWEHRRAQCTRVVISSTAEDAIIHYTCPGGVSAIQRSTC